MAKKIKKIDWSMDIIKGNKTKSCSTITARIPKKYKEFIKQNNISVSKLLMRSCEVLDNSLKFTK